MIELPGLVASLDFVHQYHNLIKKIPSLKQTAKALKNGCLEYDPVLLGREAYFQGQTRC